MFAPPVAKPKTKSAEPQRSAVAAQRLGPTALAQRQLLQRTVGNQGMIRLLTQRVGAASNAPGRIQTKLKIGAVNDPLEHEADRVADRVMRMPAPEVSVAAAPPQVSRKCAECEEEEKLQRKSAGPEAAGEAPAIVHDVLRSAGQPLDAETRSFFEPKFGRGFSDVRVHTDASAGQSARAVNAHAYTVGNSMVFGSGRFAPGTQEGRRLLAHELTHVVQQSGSDGAYASRNGESGGLSDTLSRTSEQAIMRKGFESTIKICHRELETRKFTITKGGLRVVLIPKELDRGVVNCEDFDFWVQLTRSEDWSFDDDIGECGASTGGTRSFSFAKLPSGTYYLTIFRNFDHPYCCLEGNILVFDETVSGDSAGFVRDEFSPPAVMDIVHGALDVLGFFPVLGAIPDGINAIIYVVEGDWANAGLSAVAMVPLWGDGVKLGVIAGKSVIKISEKAVLKLGTEGIVKGLKEVKAASKVGHATESTAKAGTKIEKEAAKKFEKEAAGTLDKEAAEKLEKETAEKLEKEAAEKELKKIAQCKAIWAEYDALVCVGCKGTDTPAERAAKIACITAMIAGRELYLRKKCDYVLQGSIDAGSVEKEINHRLQVKERKEMLEKCFTKPTVPPPASAVG